MVDRPLEWVLKWCDSTFLARCGVGGGASRRMPKGALMSGWGQPALPNLRGFAIVSCF